RRSSAITASCTGPTAPSSSPACASCSSSRCRSPSEATAMRFTAELGERGVVVPGDPRAEFGGARAPVAGTVNGTPFRGRLMVYGGVTYLGFRREIRDAAGIEQGDEVEVDIERDDAPREVEIPEALASALAADPAARTAFE